MKNFKFRAWDKEENKMWNVETLYIEDEWVKVNDGSIYGVTKDLIRSYCLMQSTGLRDKNGVEIYEGDIVQHSEKPNPCFSSPFKVIQARTGEWRLDNFRCGTVLAFSNQDELEVLGNIYENPELLEDN